MKLRAITYPLSLSNSLFNTPNPFPAFSSNRSRVDHAHSISTSKVAIPLRGINLEGYILIRKIGLGIHKAKRTHHIMYFPRILLQFLAVTGLCQAAQPRESSTVCTVPAAGSSSIDDAPAILEAFRKCGHGGKIILTNTTYHINSVMNTTGLRDCEVDLQGTLLVSLDTNHCKSRI